HLFFQNLHNLLHERWLAWRVAMPNRKIPAIPLRPYERNQTLALAARLAPPRIPGKSKKTAAPS
ncbi:MAG: hypothetical protein KDE58_36785, partial [Caldilineaceae bacterium]|nr:hypothetical protein [Caldilineaceae bacterium]